MNLRALSLAVLVGAVLVGCGGTEVAPEEETGRATEALSACTTLVSCEAVSGRACTEPRAERDCCSAAGTPGTCTCVINRWFCVY
ncbi:hypothetical protein F0U60_53520 [Archangium minus]|uniref:Lipoprotein n=1 Tax=Archangium minus TaxID=83450 RepID=A0ABY9X9A2_9BACT|nr:hypothetical protein F0U61_53190 [Archangium violaceum]WNG51960.1 hypothetical protein F0U60_53520 [Archangium minus]